MAVVQQQGEPTTSALSPAAELRAFLAEALPRWRDERPDGESWEGRLAWQRILNQGGWVAPAWPVKFGGRGLGTADRVACDAEMGRAGAPQLPTLLGVKNVGPTIIAFGNEDQRKSLGRILSTEEIWCQGFSEPDAGSDLAGLKTRAVVDGDEFVINGQKTWTSEGMNATHMQLLVRTDPAAAAHKGISVLLIPLDLPGIERRPIGQMTGESGFAEVFFTDARVPRSSLLGPFNDGWRVTMTTLSYERSGVITLAVRLEEDVVAAVRRLGEAGLSDPVLRQDVMQRYIEARLVGLLGQRSLASLDNGGEPGPEHSVIKLAWSVTNQRTAETFLRVVGPGAMVNADPAAGYAFLRSRASTIAAGTTEVMKNILAERVLGLPK